MEKEREVERRAESPPAAEPTIRVAGTRCPYCHEDVARESADVCRDCLARHHADCWTEGTRCGACGSVHVLRPVLQDRALPPRCHLAGCSARGVARGSASLSMFCRSHAESTRSHHATVGWVLIAAGVLSLVVMTAVAVEQSAGGALAAGLIFFVILSGGGASIIWHTRALPPLPPPEADKTGG